MSDLLPLPPGVPAAASPGPAISMHRGRTTAPARAACPRARRPVDATLGVLFSPFAFTLATSR
ncbi:hypothetical protein SAMN05444002_3029 [Vannielia litorea]|uniref:Uncharacterized protein n=1 Tax=Vannielia litorea TaxID=1217970 RepID=A0A1N6H314_9RHOB|nr:hypothetical protein SAMN05444002_3029 [Vannielia litorea]